MLYEQLAEPIIEVAGYLTEAHETPRREMARTMGGEALELFGEKIERLTRELDEAKEKAMKEGREEGIEQGREEGIDDVLESLRSAGVDETLLETAATARAHTTAQSSRQ